MWPFSRNLTLEKSGILNGLTDWHSHILPGVDDGVQEIGDSLKILEEYERQGVRKVWLTPHIMEDIPNSTSFLKERFEELKQAWKGNVELALGSENMLDSLFEERLAKNDFLPIGFSNSHLLVETSYFNAPYNMDGLIKETQRKGYTVILAHPERYRYMDNQDYSRLKNLGVLFQMNLLSLNGFYGEQAAKKALWLVKNRMVNFFGSDLHRLDHLLFSLKKPYADKTLCGNLMNIART